MTDLTKISVIGKNMAQHLTHAGYPDIVSLKGQDPDEVYANDCFARGVQVDRGALRRYRSAARYADHDGNLPEGKTNW
ncbi:MAG: helix-hairpin-helix domain-containing protein [Deltaproteobacteria bacterium]|jgi:hypothetical protein|nr:helix-hairpin-helix domain-containing protein [Deltaproteobacteria bacterium]